MNLEDLALAAETARRYAGLKFRGDRAFHIESRLTALARREGSASPEQLIERLRNAPDDQLCRAVAEALAQGETSFFRDREVFERLKLEILPHLAAQRPDGVVRVLSAGCATGQETYSLVLAAQAASPPVRLDVLGVDLSERALDKARSGLYTQFEVQRGLPIRMLIHNFDRMDDMWVASPALREAVQWRRANLLDDLSGLGVFDLILCRNVLSGMEAEARKQVIVSLCGRLADHGWLALGAEESCEEADGLVAGRGFGLHRKASGASLRAA